MDEGVIVGLEFVDLLQVFDQPVNNGIEPVKNPDCFEQQQVEEVVQPDVRLLVGKQRLAMLLVILLGEDHVPAKGEGGNLLFDDQQPVTIHLNSLRPSEKGKEGIQATQQQQQGEEKTCQVEVLQQLLP
jgi:hypothetical protein